MSTLWVRHASSSAAEARRCVLAAFDTAGPWTAEQAQDAALIASELVGNAVRHAAPLPDGQLAVNWSVDSDGYEISVTDGGVATSPTSPCAEAIAAQHAGCRDAHGRGLLIVAELADCWGVAADNGTTTVWARTHR